jgi:hypothetical protein
MRPLENVTAEFLNDRDIAQLFGMSPGWVRMQRHFRRFGRDHFLTIDPVLIGTRPRYRREDVAALVKATKALQTDNASAPEG